MHDALISFTNVVDKYGIPAHVAEEDTLNWFQVYWDGDIYPGNSEANTCEANGCKSSNGNCVCRTSVLESVVFTDTIGITEELVLSELKLGSFGPHADSVSTNLNNVVTVHKVAGAVDELTVFEIMYRGKTMYLKNIRSTVTLYGWETTPKVYEVSVSDLCISYVHFFFTRYL